MDFRDVKEFIKDSFGYLVAILLVFLVFVYGIAFDEVYGDSMYPTYANKDILLISKIHYIVGDVHAGDIIAFSDTAGVNYIKRVIGVPGDNLYVKDNVLYINGYEKEETYLKSEVVTDDFALEDICTKELCPDGVIPNDYYFVMGDNRAVSLDSRQSGIGLIPKDKIIGKAIIKFWPIK